MKLTPRLVAFTAAAAAAFFCNGCYTVPVTGRHAMNLIDETELAKMTSAAFDQQKHTTPLSKDKEKLDQLRRVGERLQRAIPVWDMPDADWEFVLFDDKEINAFAMPGGKVGVYTGLFRVVSTDDQLAAVLGHEIAHVTAKHVHEAISRQLLMATGGLVGGVALAGSGMGYYGVESVMSIYGLGTMASGFAFDRAKEKEADHIGLIYMAKAGYDPEEAIKVFEKLDELETEETSAMKKSWTSTHPPNPERIAALRDALPQARKAAEQSVIKPIPVVIK